MTATLILGLASTMVATSFLSGIFGMAGGLVLMGVLLALLPLPEAMTLHAVTQMASNGWRGLLWVRYVRWRAAAAFLAGCAVAFIVWTQWRYVPSKPVAFILLGLSPFVVRLVPADIRPDPERLAQRPPLWLGLDDVDAVRRRLGALIDAYFLGRTFDRREIVATKAVCQTLSHTAKLAYFGGLVDQASGLDLPMAAAAIAASMLGTSLARPVLESLTETQYRVWATRIITAIAAIYLVQGGYLLLLGRS